MSIDEAIKNAQPQPGVVEDHGEVFWKRGDNFVIYDRNRREFVRSGCITIPAEKKPEKGVRGWLKERAEVIAEHYQHWKDLVNIAGKYGLWTAAQYEGRSIMGSLRTMQLVFAMAASSPDYERASVADLPNPIVQVDEPRLPGMPEDPFYLGSDDYRGRDEFLGDNSINILGPKSRPDPNHDLSELLSKYYEIRESGEGDSGDF